MSPRALIVFAALAGCGPSAEERADQTIAGAIEALGRTDANDVEGREAQLDTLESAPPATPVGEAARAACARYYRTQVDLRRALQTVERLAPKDRPNVEPTLEILSALTEAEDLQKRATAELAPCTEATGALRIKRG